jgi:hypothetical protein
VQQLEKDSTFSGTDKVIKTSQNWWLTVGDKRYIWHFEEAGGKLEIIIFSIFEGNSSRFEGRKSWRSRISKQPIIMFIFDGIILAFYHIL